MTWPLSKTRTQWRRKKKTPSTLSKHTKKTHSDWSSFLMMMTTIRWWYDRTGYNDTIKTSSITTRSNKRWRSILYFNYAHIKIFSIQKLNTSTPPPPLSTFKCILHDMMTAPLHPNIINTSLLFFFFSLCRQKQDQDQASK